MPQASGLNFGFLECRVVVGADRERLQGVLVFVTTWVVVGFTWRSGLSDNPNTPFNWLFCPAHFGAIFPFLYTAGYIMHNTIYPAYLHA